MQKALEIRTKAYCPYSNFPVGAAILTEVDGVIYSGCNVENSVMTPSICAERTAVPQAVMNGYTKITKVAVVAHQLSSYTPPCGVCRQVLSEFRGSDGDMDIYLSKPTLDTVLCTKLSKLLPLSFVSYTQDNVTTK